MTEKHIRELVTLWKACEEEDFLATHPDPVLVGLGELDAGLIQSSQEARSTWSLAFPVGASEEPRQQGVHVGEIFRVVGKNGPDQAEILVGRSPFCDIVLDDGAVSELHCQLQRQGEGFAVCDQGSTNGTKINGEPIDPETPLPLQNEDVLTVGRLSFKFFTPRVLFQYVRLGLLGRER
jgi:hypothetical protein